MENKPKRRNLDEQIALAQKELAQKEARVKELLGRQRSKEDKARTNRLCRRGGLVEKLLPGLAVITDKQFDAFLEKTLLTGDAEKILAAMLPTPSAETTDGTDTPQGGESAANEPTETAAQGNTPPAQKNAHTPHNSGNSNGGGNHHQNGRPAHQQHNNGANGNGNGGNGAHNGG